VEPRGLAAHHVGVNQGGRGEMIKAPISLQDLRRRLYVKAKTDRSGGRRCLGFSWMRWSREWLYGTLGLFSESRVSSGQSLLCSRSSLIGLITLDVKCAGARSAGNPHATCDVAGAGNGATVTPKRARRGKPRIQAKEGPKGNRASARPYVRPAKAGMDSGRQSHRGKSQGSVA
jgi:hypothetical protein